MSSTAPTPEPTGLSEAQRRVLDDLAAHENAADPGYVLRMNAPAARRPAADAAEAGAAGPPGASAPVGAGAARGRRRDLAVQLAVAGVILALVLPVAWTIALALTVALVLGPAYLVARALREGGSGPPSPDDPGRR